MIFLDFEASAAMGGFPIEVGFCVIDADRRTRSAAKLIRHDEWLDDLARWDWQASQIHNIDRNSIMEYGVSPRAVMTWLNKELAGMVAVADSPMDGLWLQELAIAAGIAPAFGLTDDIPAVFSGPEIARAVALSEVNPVCPKTHRADRDAQHLAVRYLLSLADSAPVHRLYLAGPGLLREPLLSQ